MALLYMYHPLSLATLSATLFGSSPAFGGRRVEGGGRESGSGWRAALLYVALFLLSHILSHPVSALVNGDDGGLDCSRGVD